MMTGPGIETFSWLVEGILLLIVGCFGIVGNTISIIWFSRKMVQRNFHHLMLYLAAFDLIYVCLSISIFSIPSLVPSLWTNSIYLHMIPMLLPMAQVGLSGSIYLTLAIAVERYCTVCHPFWKLSHAWPSSYYILPISIISFLYNTPKFFEHEVIQKRHETNLSSMVINVSDVVNITSMDTVATSLIYEEIVPTSLRTNPIYVKIYCVYLNLVIHGLIPLFLLLIINISIYKQIGHITTDQAHSQSNLHAREMKMAQVSCIIVAVFIVCHGVRWIPNVYELTRAEQENVLTNWPSWVQYTTCFSHLLTVLNSSVNFYIYFFKHVNMKSRRRFSTTELVLIKPSMSLQRKKPEVTLDTFDSLDITQM